MDDRRSETVLLTGASGYVGGRLLRALADRPETVRCLARRPEYLTSRVGPGVEVVRGDCLARETLPAALAGIHTAYYLVHSMGSSEDFVEQDRIAARNFGEAARAAGVRRIVYLGGLGGEDAELSAHLRSRHETGEVLRGSGVPVIEFQASIILGSGSLSFELIRALTERVPVMICPSWVRTIAQPIAIEDVVAYLVAALDLPPDAGSRVFQIGGADRVSYGDIMREYARQRGLGRLMIPVPVLTPYLSSLWLGLVTPVYARIGRKIIEGMRNPTAVEDGSALEIFPIRPRGLSESIDRAIRYEDREFAESRWSDAISSAGEQPSYGGVRLGSRIVDLRTRRVEVPPAAAFAPIRRIGGGTGWYYGQFLWRLRGFLDLLVGGVGMRRGRRDPETVVVGDALDFWRVEEFEPDRRLRLAAEMRIPGRAWLELEVKADPTDGAPTGSGGPGAGRGSTISQTAVFEPAGLSGLLYWYLLYPVHALIFRGMLQRIADLATVPTSPDASAPPRLTRAAQAS